MNEWRKLWPLAALIVIAAIAWLAQHRRPVTRPLVCATTEQWVDDYARCKAATGGK